MWLCSRRSALTTCKTSNIPNTFVTRKQQGAGCPRTQRSRPPTPAAAAPLSVLARSPGRELKGVRHRWGGALLAPLVAPQHTRGEARLTRNPIHPKP